MDLDPGASCKLSIFCFIKSTHPECSSICNSHKATNSQDGVHINDMDVAFHLNTLFLKGVASAQQNGLGSNFFHTFVQFLFYRLKNILTAVSSIALKIYIEKLAEEMCSF